MTAEPSAAQIAHLRKILDQRGRFLWLDALIRDDQFTRNDYRVAVWAWSRSDEDGERIIGGRIRIADDLGMHPNTVDRALKKLTALGWLALSEGGAAHRARGMANVYRLTFPTYAAALFTIADDQDGDQGEHDPLTGNTPSTHHPDGDSYESTHHPDGDSSTESTHHSGPSTHHSGPSTHHPDGAPLDPSPLDPSPLDRSSLTFRNAGAGGRDGNRAKSDESIDGEVIDTGAASGPAPTPPPADPVAEALADHIDGLTGPQAEAAYTVVAENRMASADPRYLAFIADQAGQGHGPGKINGALRRYFDQEDAERQKRHLSAVPTTTPA